ncbi:MAG: Molybdopterin-guanine dinucleotide biosynthesis adapter protein [Paracidovorax wautersii]|uniref:Molybdopterin-guanine dinucleotide biosynthesis adapter protein n=1 Tax=Paracidovorax wautersii TaxID=1177982 RepID=A0A7V8JNV5_9BURK|nr:MAG: Molybdopterin-guanine dinucleotide biosynthesis adapter protein [Paracidovorax wautersii]
MKVLGIAGYSGAGKTTLLERLIPALGALGQRVSVIKHTHHDFDVDQPGKDSWRHRQAGAHEVLVASDCRWALMHENRPPAEPDWRALLARLDGGVDWVLAEGFKHGDLPKLEVWRAANGKPVRYADDTRVIAIATPDSAQLPVPPAAGVAVLDLDQPQAIAQWLVSHSGLADWDGAAR